MAGPVPGGLGAERLASIVIGALDPAERAGAVAYLCPTPFAAGAELAVPRQPLVIERDCYVAFVDAQPDANWGHACRYLLIDARTGEVSSHPRRFPAFGAGDDRWRVVYRASR
jgi:hypothetical protein